MTEQLLFTPAELERFKALQNIFKHDTANSTATASNLHGLNPWGTLGLYGAPGVDPTMYSTLIHPTNSFSASLPTVSSEILQIRKEIMTGITDDIGNNATDFCADPPRGGNMKVCQQDYEFGKVSASTDTVSGVEVGAYYTRADMDRRVIPNNAIPRSPFVPDVFAGADPNSISYKQFLQTATALNRRSEQVLIQGNKAAPANGAGSIRFFMEQPEGLDRLIKAGHVDAKTGNACEAVDSRVVNYNALITGESATYGNIVYALTDAYMGMTMDVFGGMEYDMTNSVFALLIHPRMKTALLRQWVCSYLTNGCVVVNDSGQRVNIDATAQQQMQMQMMNGNYLPINETRVPLLYSWFVPISNVGNDLWNASAYLVPLVLNGQVTTYIEYFNTANAQQVAWYNHTGLDPYSRPINGGMYRMSKNQTRDCIEYTFKGQWRLRMDAPFAAIRWDNITFTDRSQMRSPIPGESYHKDGGVTTRGSITY